MSVRGGIDLGGTKIQAVLVDEGNAVIGEARHPTPREGGPQAVADELVAVLSEAAEVAGLPAGELAGVGVGSPGEIDGATGTVSQARNLPGWEGSFALGPALSEALGVEHVRIGNDVTVATNAEFVLGVGAPYQSLLGVFWGTGVGGGVVIDGKVWDGRGSAGEIGHMVVKRGGAHCPCGRRGCMEAYAGRAAMEARARELQAHGRKTELFEIMEQRGRERLTAGIWARALKKEDAVAQELVDRAIGALGTAIASACNLLDVEAVVLGGGLGLRLGPDYLDAIQREIDEHLFTIEHPPDVQIAQLGDLGGAIGAALLAASPNGSAKERSTSR
ncbi:MAG: ROK family protein [Solirubrobacteraceae bacterium]